ncbi:hypothetical protein BDB01DRAFT_776684 [Pilobolus umbonatus]|nr:hypothetical protein BDB01DRAFT_776684 [Pilobolus umbonatus]
MNSFNYSSTYNTTSKSKLLINTFLSFLKKRSQSNMNAYEDVQYNKSSFNGSESLSLAVDKYMNKCKSFNRRSSDTSTKSLPTKSLSVKEYQQERDKVYTLYHLAEEEVRYAIDSCGSPYYPGDLIAAKEAIDNCNDLYLLLLEHYSTREYTSIIESTIGSDLSRLILAYESLPSQDDHC